MGGLTEETNGRQLFNDLKDLTEGTQIEGVGEALGYSAELERNVIGYGMGGGAVLGPLASGATGLIATGAGESAGVASGLLDESVIAAEHITIGINALNKKWRKRATVEDMKTGPSEPRSTVLSEAEAEEAMVVAFRRHTLLPLDDCLYALKAPMQR